MGIVKCGNCRKYHPSIGDVRECFNRQKVEVVQLELPIQPATDRQKNFIKKLMEDRVWDGEAFEIETISKDQASGIIGKLLNSPEKATRMTDLVVGTVDIPKQGTFTVVWSETEWRTYRFFVSDNTNFKPGKVIVEFLSGPENSSDYTGFGHGLTDQTVRIWNRFKEESKLVEGLRFLLGSKEAQLKAGEMYAIKSNRCWRCNKKLTVPVSVARGLGPVCAEIVGVA